MGTFTTTYNVGSAVKGATVLTGYQTGVISPGTSYWILLYTLVVHHPKSLGKLLDRSMM